MALEFIQLFEDLKKKVSIERADVFRLFVEKKHIKQSRLFITTMIQC